MTALAEPPVSFEDLFVESLFHGYALKSTTFDDPDVVLFRRRFYANLGLQEEVHDQPVIRWFKLVKDGCHLVGSFVFRADRAIEVTDFYPAPSREGVEAGYIALNLLKVLVDRRIIPYWIGGIVESNEFGHRHVEKFFGIKPRSRVYVYDGVPF